VSTFARAGYVRFATLLAVALALLLSGVVVGAAGGPLIMGTANSAGTTNTSLTTSSTGTALLVTQTGTGTALRGVAANGIAGFFSSANGSGVSGVVAANNKYGVYGGNDAATFGGGAAVRADGKQNNGVVATTANAAADALRGVNTGGGQALDLVVNAGVAPMTVNSDTKVADLNADLLDGMDSAQFIQGLGVSAASAVSMSAGNDASVGGAAYGFTAKYFCPISLASDGSVTFHNSTANVMNVFYDNGLAGPVYNSLAGGGDLSIPTAAIGEGLTIQFQGTWIGTVWLFSVHRATDCHMQAQWIVRN
jgi:hypothetical protein